MDKHKKKLNKLIHSTALEHGLTDEQVKDIEGSMYKFIRETTNKFNLKQINNEEDLENLNSVFKIQKLGRLYVDKFNLKQRHKRKEIWKD